MVDIPLERAAVRRILQRAFLLEQSLDAFLIDYYPEIATESGGLPPTKKINMLLAQVETCDIVEKLERVAEYNIRIAAILREASNSFASPPPDGKPLPDVEAAADRVPPPSTQPVRTAEIADPAVKPVPSEPEADSRSGPAADDPPAPSAGPAVGCENSQAPQSDGQQEPPPSTPRIPVGRPAAWSLKSALGMAAVVILFCLSLVGLRTTGCGSPRLLPADASIAPDIGTIKKAEPVDECENIPKLRKLLRDSLSEKAALPVQKAALKESAWARDLGLCDALLSFVTSPGTTSPGALQAAVVQASSASGCRRTVPTLARAITERLQTDDTDDVAAPVAALAALWPLLQKEEALSASILQDLTKTLDERATDETTRQRQWLIAAHFAPYLAAAKQRLLADQLVFLRLELSDFARSPAAATALLRLRQLAERTVRQAAARRLEKLLVFASAHSYTQDQLSLALQLADEGDMSGLAVLKAASAQEPDPGLRLEATYALASQYLKNVTECERARSQLKSAGLSGHQRNAGLLVLGYCGDSSDLPDLLRTATQVATSEPERIVGIHAAGAALRILLRSKPCLDVLAAEEPGQQDLTFVGSDRWAAARIQRASVAALERAVRSRLEVLRKPHTPYREQARAADAIGRIRKELARRNAKPSDPSFGDRFAKAQAAGLQAASPTEQALWILTSNDPAQIARGLDLPGLDADTRILLASRLEPDSERAREVLHKALEAQDLSAVRALAVLRDRDPQLKPAQIDKVLELATRLYQKADDASRARVIDSLAGTPFVLRKRELLSSSSQDLVVDVRVSTAAVLADDMFRTPADEQDQILAVVRLLFHDRDARVHHYVRQLLADLDATPPSPPSVTQPPSPVSQPAVSARPPKRDPAPLPPAPAAPVAQGGLRFTDAPRVQLKITGLNTNSGTAFSVELPGEQPIKLNVGSYSASFMSRDGRLETKPITINKDRVEEFQVPVTWLEQQLGKALSCYRQPEPDIECMKTALEKGERELDQSAPDALVKAAFHYYRACYQAEQKDYLNSIRSFEQIVSNVDVGAELRTPCRIRLPDDLKDHIGKATLYFEDQKGQCAAMKPRWLKSGIQKVRLPTGKEVTINVSSGDETTHRFCR